MRTVGYKAGANSTATPRSAERRSQRAPEVSPLLGEFVKSEDFEAAGRLCGLDPATAVPHAYRTHCGTEKNGCLAEIGIRQQGSRGVACLGHKECPVEFTGTAFSAGHRAFPDYQDYSPPSGVWIIVQIAGHKQKPVTDVIPSIQIQVPFDDYRQGVRRRHPCGVGSRQQQRRQIRSISGTASGSDGYIRIGHDALREIVELAGSLHADKKGAADIRNIRSRARHPVVVRLCRGWDGTFHVCKVGTVENSDGIDVQPCGAKGDASQIDSAYVVRGVRRCCWWGKNRASTCGSRNRQGSGKAQARWETGNVGWDEGD